MSRTITSSYATGVTLTSPGDNPVTVGASANLANTGAPALAGAAAVTWTIDSAGSIIATGSTTGATGILLAGDGSVTNQPGGMVSGFDVGVSIAGAGNVVNNGSISAAQTTGSSYSYNPTTRSFIPLSGGVILGSGQVSNAASAVISSYFEGVVVGGGGSVVNAGSISSSTAGFGVVLTGGGHVDNVAGGTIAGGRYGILAAGGGTATVANAGFITSAAGIAVDLSNGGSVDNDGSIAAARYGVVTGGSAGSTVTNQGSISGTTRAGVGLFGGGTLDNAGTASITGAYGILTGAGSTATITNRGQILGQSEHGIALFGGGSIDNAANATVSAALYGILASGGAQATVTNAGTITGQTQTGIGLIVGGTVSNAATGTIQGGWYGVAAGGITLSSTVINQGSIAGTAQAGVALYRGGYAYNGTTGIILGGRYGIAASGNNPSSVVNKGSITGTIYGVGLYGGGTASNASGGTITGGYFGIQITSAEGTVNNDGFVSSSATFAGSLAFDAAGIDLDQGGTIHNGVSGSILATWKGVEIGDATASVGGTLLNEGFIYASNSAGNTGAAVWIHGPGLISNAAGGTIAGGPFGIVSYFQTTVINLGTIAGTNFAIDPVSAGFANRVIVGPGAVFSGLVSGGNALGSSIVSVLELASGTIAGTIDGFGSKYIGFGEVIVDSGANWTFGGTVAASQTLDLSGTNASLTLSNPGLMAGTIIGFDTTDTIDLAGITDVTDVSLGANNLLTISEGAGPGLTLQLDPTASFVAGFSHGAVSGGTALTLACFAAGTSIATEQGPRKVEFIQPGQRVPTRFGGLQPVQWVGHRSIDCSRHPRPHTVWPVLIQAGAFGPNQPAADLSLSPDHAVYVQEVLIPVRHLVNGTTIRQVPTDTITYFHLELAQHDSLLAEGLLAESYLDVGDRANFANADGPMRLFPDFSTLRLDLCTRWEAQGCAPLVVVGAALEAARRQIEARAAQHAA